METLVIFQTFSTHMARIVGLSGFCDFCVSKQQFDGGQVRGLVQGYVKACICREQIF